MRARIGIALGGGAARGWAHIGVLNALAARGIMPDVVSGASIGALVGAAYAGDRLDALETWVLSLNRLDVLKLLDARIAGGVIEGNRVMQAIEQLLPEGDIGSLERPYAAVATDLDSGRAVWLRDGPIIAAVRASCAMPGLMPPRRHEDTWLVDGGLVDPVPVTLCRMLGADVVIAVDLGAFHYRRAGRAESRTDEGSGRRSRATQETRGYLERLQTFVGDWLEFGKDETPAEPGLLDVIAASINIMQERITRARLAGDPPEIELTPALDGIALMDFHRARDAIAAGEAVVAARAGDLGELVRAAR